MHFLPDVYVPCDICKGKRYNRETLDIQYKGKNINEVLDMTIEEAREFFDPIPADCAQAANADGCGFILCTTGQSATTLSGGEAQRVKLSRQLSKRDTGKTLYILDEPTTGLHFHDIKQLLAVIHRLRDHGNTVVVIEHNLDVIKTADWIIDLGPEGGSGGGEIIAQGTPEAICEVERSHTARFLKPMLNNYKDAMMLEEQFKVRFYETDALGHVNNTVVPMWIETGRLPIFEFFGEMSLETQKPDRGSAGSRLP